MNRTSYGLIFYLFICTFTSTKIYSQENRNTIIQGHVLDAKTKEPIPFVSVLLENTNVGTLTDSKGAYRIVTSSVSYKISFSFVGYEKVSKIISPGTTQTINVDLNNSSVELKEVVVKPKKKYSNKNNPSVDLIENVIKHKSTNRKENLDYYTYDKYEKMVLELSNVREKFEQLGIFKKYSFIFNNIDTTRIGRGGDLPIFIKETESRYYYRKNPKSEKTIINGEKTINFNEYVDIKGLTANLNYLYQNIDIYNNTIFFLSNNFLSPVASTAPVLYRYYIQDTTTINNVKCIKLFFEPRNPADFLFHGFLFITKDSDYAVRKVDISFNKGINIDWIKNVRIIQDFENIGPGNWLLTQDEVMIDFVLSPGMPGLLGHRIVSYNNYSVNEQVADTVFKGLELVRNSDASDKDNRFWESVRNPPIEKSEISLYNLVDSVKKIPAFKREAKLVNLLTSNFLTLGSVEFGPDDVFFSYNPVEGSRIRFGGRTTPQFNKRIYLESYLAYGFNDRQFKYNIAAAYSFPGTSIYKFPVRALKVNYRYDIMIPGQQLLLTEPDNIFYSVKRGQNDKMIYYRTFGLEYQHEYENHFSWDIGYNFTRLSPAGTLNFTTSDTLSLTNNIKSITTPEAYLRLRYARKEQFHEGKLYRVLIPSKYPVYELQYILGSKSLGNDYNYQKLQFTVSRRFWLSIFGYTDVVLDAGKIFGNVPYPLLFIANANQSYSFEMNSYNMMNFMEFVSDQYVALQIDHSFNGFFFNKVPLLKKLKLREVFTFKALYGGVGNNNNPYLQPDLFRLPTDSNGLPLTYTLDKKPYIEASVGVSNIFRIFRVDLVKRLTYLNNPHVPSLGIRLQFKFDI